MKCVTSPVALWTVDANQWTLCTDEMQNPTCLYWNCVQFTLSNDQSGIVTLVDQFRHKEVYLLQVDPETAKTISNTIGSTIHHELEEVCKFLKCSRSIQKALLCLHHNRSHIITLHQSEWTVTPLLLHPP